MGTSKLITDHKTYHSLDDHLAAEDASLHNSNMGNLAAAVRKIEDGIENLKEEIARLEELKDEIREAAADPATVQDTSLVRKLFDKADADLARVAKRRRW